MKLDQLVQDADLFIALEAEELALKILPWIAQLRNMQLGAALSELCNTFKSDQGQAEVALREAWAWLEGQALLLEDPRYVSPNSYRVLSRKAKSLITDKTQQTVVSRRLLKEHLHPAIRNSVWANYLRGSFDTAVFEAMKAVEVSVRDASGLTKEIGVSLMRKAFDKYNGPLTDMSTDEGEREMRSHLFAGAIGSFKNPHSHRNIPLTDPDEAFEIIALANLLLRTVDGCKKQQQQD